MSRPFPLLVAALLMTAACAQGPGGASAEDSPVAAPTTSDSGVETSAAQPAPDFSLVMGDGSTFTLSQERRPVFLLFWAEW